jgi:hypothetical protein
MNYKKFLLIIVMMVLLVSPVMAMIDGNQLGYFYSYDLNFLKQHNSAITQVDTNSNGSIIQIGFVNGTIAAYNKSGTFLWAVATNGSIEKLISDENGDVVFMNSAQESGYISAAGTKASKFNVQTGMNLTDIGFTINGSHYITSSSTPYSNLTLYNKTGNQIASFTNSTNASGVLLSNVSFNFTQVALDPFGRWVTAINQSDEKLYLYNISYSGVSSNISFKEVAAGASGDPLEKIDVPVSGGVVTSYSRFIRYGIYKILDDGSDIFDTEIFEMFDGVTYDIAASSGAGFIIVAKGPNTGILDPFGYLSTVTTTGGPVYSVDIAQTSGDFAVFGGYDGSVYLYNYFVEYGWAIVYKGNSNSTINSTAITWSGEMECVGRSNGNLECYNNNYDLTSSLIIPIYVYKNTVPYSAEIKIEESETYPYSWHNFGSSNITSDNRGTAILVGARTGYYYRLTIDSVSYIFVADENIAMNIVIGSEQVFSYQVFIYKNGVPYSTYLKVEESKVYPYSWYSAGSNIPSDSNGMAIVSNATEGFYYRLTAGPELKEVIYTADSDIKQVVISIDTTQQIVGGFNYTASYNTSYPGNITVNYNDMITPNNVVVKIAEKATGKIVYNQQFNADPDISLVYKGNPNIAYEIQWVWDRDGVRGMAGQTIFVPAGGGFNFGNVDQNVKYALFYILFLFVCGLFTYATRTIGAFISAIFYVFLVVLQILPFTLLNIAGMITILTLAAVFGDAKEKR